VSDDKVREYAVLLLFFFVCTVAFEVAIDRIIGHPTVWEWAVGWALFCTIAFGAGVHRLDRRERPRG